jgi:hypothetical protein
MTAPVAGWRNNRKTARRASGILPAIAKPISMLRGPLTRMTATPAIPRAEDKAKIVSPPVIR